MGELAALLDFGYVNGGVKVMPPPAFFLSLTLYIRSYGPPVGERFVV